MKILPFEPGRGFQLVPPELGVRVALSFSLQPSLYEWSHSCDWCVGVPVLVGMSIQYLSFLMLAAR